MPNHKLPQGWQWKRLGDVCEINPRNAPPRLPDDTPVTFVPMPAVNAEHGIIDAAQTRKLSQVRKGYTRFESGDVIFAKITPCMENGKAAIIGNLENGLGFGSTEFHVMRPNPVVAAEWLFHFVRQQSLRDDAKVHFTGTAGQQRVPVSFMQSALIPIPPLAEQRRLVARLDAVRKHVNRARAALRQAKADAKTLWESEIMQTFAGQWAERSLGEIGDIASGVALGRRLNDFDMVRVPYLRVANVKDGHLELTNVKTIGATNSEITKLRLKHGDLLLTEGGDPDKLGRGTIWQEQLPLCIHQNHIFRVRFDQREVLPEFAASYIGSPHGKAYFLRHAKQTTGIATINRTVLSAFPLPFPAIKRQRQLVTHLNTVRDHIQRAEAAIEKILRDAEVLWQSILAAAMRGKL